jgi:hypothetical protein
MAFTVEEHGSSLVSGQKTLGILMPCRIQKIPAGILVHRSLLRTRLYLISRVPWILEVIIRKNAEPGRNYWMITHGNE